MMKLYIALSVVLLLLFSGCGNKPKPGEDDTLTSGTITIAVDETFRPIAEEELQVFHALTPDATVHPVYCSEVTHKDLSLKYDFFSTKISLTHPASQYTTVKYTNQITAFAAREMASFRFSP